MAEALHQPGSEETCAAGQENPFASELIPQSLSQRRDVLQILRKPVHSPRISAPGTHRELFAELATAGPHPVRGYKSSAAAKESASTDFRCHRSGSPGLSAPDSAASRPSSIPCMKAVPSATGSRGTHHRPSADAPPEGLPSRTHRGPAHPGTQSPFLGTSSSAYPAHRTSPSPSGTP